MIWFIIRIKPFDTFSKRASLIIDEFIVVAFVGFATAWYGEWKEDEKSKMREGYALCTVLVITIMKNVITLVN